ncbi:DUF504 domain-containing protein [Candidatus Woesearchaeota archaeon]|nr:DUF504 domain-containing protein [Candidatus Woesearchaeota archaeon]
MVSRHKIKRYFWNAFGVMGMVLFWAGIWDGLGNLGFLVNPVFSLITGVSILFFASLIFKKVDFFKKTKKSIGELLDAVHHHKNKSEFTIKYHDKIKKKHHLLSAARIKKIEKSFLILKEKNKEIFIPMHRIKEILYKGKVWKG